MDTHETKSMGIGPLGSKDVIFVRQFRWTIGSDALPEYFTKTVKFDFAKKLIHLGYFEIYHPDYNGEPLQNWLDGPFKKDTLVFRTYDGSGNLLYEQTFSDLGIVEDSSSFDYSSSEVSTRQLTISYKETSRKNAHSFPREPEVIVNPRETTIDYLNARMTVPL